MIKITVLYALFAAIAMGANLGSQALISIVYRGSQQIFLALAIGTVVGLFVKYVLDKKWIFKFRTEGAGHDAKLFILYSIMGIVTTAIFWSAEYGFDKIFGTEIMRYVGGAIGLTIGYIVKYHLDKMFVFRISSSGE